MYFPDEIILPKAILEAGSNFDKDCHGFRSNRGARRGAGFSRFLQLVPGEGESQTTGKLCVLHFFYKGQLTSRVFAMDERSESGVQMLTLESRDRIELLYEDSPEATIRATVNRLLSDRDEGRVLYEFKNRATHRKWDRDCPSVRTVCARSFLSIRCG